MLHRTILIAALLSAPLALSPASVSAQERGIDRAATASANAQATNRPSDLPPGMANMPADQALPAGILLTRGAPAAESGTDSGTDSATQENCPVTFDPMSGGLVDCHGNPVG